MRQRFREPTAVLAAAGIPPVERDGFEERAWPDDGYGLVPHTFADLGDPDLAPLMLAWGHGEGRGAACGTPTTRPGNISPADETDGRLIIA